MNIVAFGVSMPFERFITQVFPYFAMASMPILAIVVFVQIIVLYKSGAFGDARRIWIAPSIILTLVFAMIVRIVFYMFFPDASLLSPYSKYAGFLTVHVLISNLISGILFTLLVLKRERIEAPPKNPEFYMRWVVPTCFVMLLPGLLIVTQALLSFVVLPTTINQLTAVSEKVRMLLSFIAFLSFFWHMSIIGNLAQISKRNKVFWMGNSLILFVLPVFYWCLQTYLFSIGRYRMLLDPFKVLTVSSLFMFINVTSALRIRKFAKDQVALEEHMHSFTK